MTKRLWPHLSRWLLQRLAEPAGTVAPGQSYHFDAAVVLVDLVGSTSLAEQMAAHGPQGIEVLERVLDSVFGALIEASHSFGGDVTHLIGDAIICLWPVGKGAGEEIRLAALHACAAALEMQAISERIGQVETPFGPASLEVRLGVGFGALEAFILGSSSQQKWVLAGPALQTAHQAEAAARPGRTQLHPTVVELLGESVVTEEGAALVRLNRPVDPAPIEWPEVDDERLHPFIHPVLVSRALAGPKEFLAEFRPAVPVFVQCGLPQEGSDLHTWLSTWVQAAQAETNRFGGWLSEIEVSDKGVVLLILFGAPVAHEDDERRAVACALALRESSAALFNLPLRIGITQGRLFTGVIGHPRRHAYTLIGDEINLASRLVEIAQPGQIIVSARMRKATAAHFVFQDLGTVVVRGKSEPVPVYTVLGTCHAEEGVIGQYLAQHERLVGRGSELATIQQVLDRAQVGPGQVLAIVGEAGIGKSHLASELVHRWVAQGGVALGGHCLSFARETPYLPWRWIVAAHCRLGSDMDGQEQILRLAQALRPLPSPTGEADYWQLRLPLLAEVLGLSLPDNDLTGGLQGEVRRDNTMATVQALLQAAAVQAPTLVLIEDAHWADELSLQLAAQVATGLQESPLLLVLVHRPLPHPLTTAWQQIRHHPRYTHLELSELTAEASQTLVQRCLGEAVVPQELSTFVFERARGHPFFTEEIVRMFQDIGCIRREDGQVIFDQQRAALIRFPDTVQGVIQARVDQLDETDRLTIKVASVIGRSFLYRVLAGVYPTPIAGTQLRSHLDALERFGLTLVERRVPELEYIFKHSITREVVYESLAFAQRRLLHRALAEWYEQRYAANLEPYYSLLAYHYGQAEERDREKHYLLLAADRAGRIHAIAEAIAYFERLLSLLDREEEPARRAGVLVRLGRLVHLTGRYDQARAYFEQAVDLYEALDDPIHAAEACFEVTDQLSVHNLEAAGQYAQRGLAHLLGRPDAHHQVIAGYTRLAYLERNRGNHERAQEMLQRALSLAQETQDVEGLWRCYRVLSMHHHIRGENHEALETGEQFVYYIEQANGPLKDRIIALNNQACFAQKVGDLKAAIDYGEAGLALARRTGVLSEQVILASTLAEIYNHIGDWAMAEHVLAEGLRLLAQRPHPYHQVALGIEVGSTAYGQGDWDRAIEQWLETEKRSRTGTQQIFTAQVRARLAMAYLRRGDLEQAQHWAALGRERAEERSQTGALAESWRAQGMIERARGNWAEGKAAFEQALALAERLNDPVETAQTLLEYGLLLLEAGRAEEGRDKLRRAEEQAATISLYPVSSAAREALRVAVSLN